LIFCFQNIPFKGVWKQFRSSYFVTIPTPGATPENKHPGSRSISAARRFIFYWLPLLILCAAIIWQSSFPSLQKEALFPHQDKLLHLTAYGLMAFLAARAFDRERPGAGRSKLFKTRIFAMGFTILFGLSDEIHQAFVPGRFASIWDWFADVLGSGIGVWIFFHLQNRRSRKRKSQ